MKHLTDQDCPCNPTVIPVPKPDGSISYVQAHHEPNQTPEEQAERAACVFDAIHQLLGNDQNDDLC